MMPPVEVVQYLRESAQRSLDAAPKNLARGSAVWALSNHSHAATSYMSSGLTCWKHGLAGAAEDFRRSIGALHEGLRYLEPADQEYRRHLAEGKAETPGPLQAWWHLDVGDVLLVSYMLDREFDAKLLPHCPDPNGWAYDDLHKDRWWRFMQGCLVDAMAHGRVPEIWETVLARGRVSRIAGRLGGGTAEQYMWVIDRILIGEWDAVTAGIAELDKLYVQRRRSHYFDDEDSVDYILAALIEYARQHNPELSDRIATKHRWHG